jgi:hypothetical protein
MNVTAFWRTAAEVGPLGAVSQKAVFFILVAVRFSNLTATNVRPDYVGSKHL